MTKEDAILTLIRGQLTQVSNDADYDWDPNDTYIVMPQIWAAMELCFKGKTKVRVNIISQFISKLNLLEPYMNPIDQLKLSQFQHRLNPWNLNENLNN